MCQEGIKHLEAEYQIKELFLRLGVPRTFKGYPYLLDATLHSFHALQDPNLEPWQYRTSSRQYVNAQRAVWKAWQTCRCNLYWDQILNGDFRTATPQLQTFIQRIAIWLQTNEVVIIPSKPYQSVRTTLQPKNL